MKVVPLETLGFQPEKQEKKWSNYTEEEYLGTYVMLPRFLKVFRGKCQQIFNQRVIVYDNCNMCLGEIICFILVLAGIGIFYGFAYDDDSLSGMAASIPLMLCLIFTTKNSFLCFLFGVCYERGIFWHKIFGWLTLLGGLLHMAKAAYNKDSGWMVLASLFFIMLFSLQPIRMKFYEVFLRLHWIGFIAMSVGIFWHGILLGYIGVAYWVLDFLIKLAVIHRYTKNASKVHLLKVASNIIRVQVLNHTVPFLSGQYIYICIPQLSYFQWHPFGIQSSKGENKLELYIKVAGDWTENLMTLASSAPEGIMTKAYFSGPHGFPCVDLQSDFYKSFILIGGGIGVTPIISVTKSLIEQKFQGRPITKVVLLWTTREKDHYAEIMSEKYINSMLEKENKQNENSFYESFFHFSGESKTTEGEKSSIRDLEDKNNVRFITTRPNIKEYMKKVQTIAAQNGEKQIAVLVCGPEKLITSVQQISKEISNDTVRVDVHEEVFIL